MPHFIAQFKGSLRNAEALTSAVVADLSFLVAV